MRVGFACDGDQCTGGRGDVYGGQGDSTFQALENAFLVGACFAAASMFLFVFYMNQVDEGDDDGVVDRSPRTGSSGGPKYVAHDPKMPLLTGDDRDFFGGSATSARHPPTTRVTTYAEARQNFADLPSPKVGVV